MAFFSGLSSSIGRRLLLYGLRHIDIFDKDPADFVSVDVGKRTTLEVRDVGLHIKVRAGDARSARKLDLHGLIETRHTITSQTPSRNKSIESASLPTPSHLRPRLRRSPDIDRNRWDTSPG